VTLFTKETAVGTGANERGGARVSALSDAADLVHIKQGKLQEAREKARKFDRERGKQRGARGGRGGGRGGHRQAGKQVEQEQPHESSDDEGEGGDAAAAEESGSGGEADEAESGSEGEEVGTSASGAKIVAAALPHCDILVSTPLLLVASLRHAKRRHLPAGVTLASDAEDRLVRVVLPSLRALVLDEADKLLEMGFLEQVDAIAAARPDAYSLTAFLKAQAAADADADGSGHAEHAADAGTHNASLVQCGIFSATMPEGTQELASALLRRPVHVEIGKRGSAAATVTQKLLFVGREEGKIVAVRNMVVEGWKTPALFFVQSKDRAIQLHKALLFESIAAEVIHSDKPEAEREAIITKFRRGAIPVLIATDLLGRGLDFKGVSTVVNYDLPQSAVSYVHRIGRTGRAGKRGVAVTFFTEEDIPRLRSIANVMKLSGAPVEDWMLQIRKMSSLDKRKANKEVPDRRPIFFDKTPMLPGEKRIFLEKKRQRELQRERKQHHKHKKPRPN
jgi:ATP-dependent RNA helicase DDX52/ROK1